MKRVARHQAAAGDILLVDDPNLVKIVGFASWGGERCRVKEVLVGGNLRIIRLSDGKETVFHPGRFVWLGIPCPDCGVEFTPQEDYLCPSCREAM